MAKEQKKFTPWNKKQEEYIRLIAENQITIAIGPAGTSKTAIPAALACEKILANEITKIVISRPIVESGNGIGFLKGSMLEKCTPYMMPLLDEFNKWLGKTTVDRMILEGIIEICPPEFLRGRNMHNCFFILDEAQNCTIEQIRLVISRIGRKCKMVINGDPDQTDLKFEERDGLSFCYKALEGMFDVGTIKFTSGDIVRNTIIGPIMKRLNNENFQTFQDGRNFDKP